MITLCIPKILLKKSLHYVRMRGKNINFEDKKIKKMNFIETKK